MIQVVSTSDTLTKKNIINRIADIPGGISLVLSTLVAGAVVEEGTPLSVPASGKRTVCKQSKILTGSTVDVLVVATANHNFKVGDFIGTQVGGYAYAITDISDIGDGTTEITVGTSIDTPVVGQFIYQMAAEATEVDATLNIAYTNDTCTGLTPDATSDGVIVGGKSGTYATIVGAITGSGNATVTVSSDLFVDEVISVAVLNADTIEMVGAKIRQDLMYNAVINAHYDVVGNGAVVMLLAKTVVNGATLKNAADVILKEAFVVPSTSQVLYMADALVRADVVEGCIGSEYLASLDVNEVKY